MSKFNNRKIVDNSIFYCTCCGNRLDYSIPRIKGKEREASHLKKLFCLKCQAEKNCAECREWTTYDSRDFKFEFQKGNFDNEGNRKMPYKLFKNEHLIEWEEFMS